MVATGAGVTAGTDFGSEMVWGNPGGVLQVSTGHQVGIYTIFVPPQAVEAGSLLESRLTFPPDARVEQALFELRAEPVESARLPSVAQVRPATPTDTRFHAAATIDLGGLVTVGGILTSSSLSFGLGIDDVRRWSGTGWQGLADGPSFPETAAERLLVQSSDSDDEGADLVDRLKAVGALALPVVPGGLELLVDGRTVWFERQGSAPTEVAEPTPPVDGGARYVVDRTDAVREAVGRAIAAAADPTADVTLVVTLRATNPGALTLAPQVAYLRVHQVTFPPNGLAFSTDLAEEGRVAVDVSPPPAEDVHEVALVVRGTFPAERVHPPVGPEVNPAARLVLQVGRTVLIGLPRSLVARFGSLTGVRLLLGAVPGGSGGQVTGRLLAGDARNRPGETPPGGELVAVTVTDPEPRWCTLPFAAAVTAPIAAAAPLDGDALWPDGVDAWLELQPAYGEVECALTSAGVDDPDAPGGLLRRRLAGGGAGPLTTVPALGPMQAAIRVVGRPDRDHPLPAVRLGLEGSPEELEITPGADDVLARLTPQVPVDASGAVLLRATVAAAGSLTLDAVQVTYREVETP